jgi:hypothetical protein
MENAGVLVLTDDDDANGVGRTALLAGRGPGGAGAKATSR